MSEHGARFVIMPTIGRKKFSPRANKLENLLALKAQYR